MKQLLFLFAVLLGGNTSAQHYYRQYNIEPEFRTPSDPMNTVMNSTAGGNILLCNYNDSAVNIKCLDGMTGDLITSRTISCLEDMGVPDTGRYMGYAAFYPLQDSGIAVYYDRQYIGDAIRERGSYSSLIKLNKKLEIQWSKVCRNFDQVYLFSSGIASDAAGAVYVNYMDLRDTGFGICKIAADGHIAADRKSASHNFWETGYTPVYGYIQALEGGRLMIISQTGLESTVLDTGLNVLHHYSYTIPDGIYNLGISFAVRAVYKQPLLAGPVHKYADYRSRYYLMDTTGRILRIDTSSAANVRDITISDVNQLQLCGVKGTKRYVQAIDTSGHSLYTHTFAGMYNTQAPLVIGDDACWLSCAAGGTAAPANNVMRFDADRGTGICIGGTDLSAITFDGHLAVNNIANTIYPLVAGTFISLPGTADTIASASVSILTICTETTMIPERAVISANVFQSSADQLRVRVGTPDPDASFILRDMTGRQLLQTAVTAADMLIQLPALANGIYIWQLSSRKDGSTAGKLLLQ